MRFIVLLLALLVAVFAATTCIARAVRRRESNGSRRIPGRPQSSSLAVPLAYSASTLDGVPAPVARYFRFALADGQPVVHCACIVQAGEFALRPGEWKPFTAIEVVTTAPPAFHWHATIWMMPLLPVGVRDGYAAGVGAMKARLLGLFSVASATGTPEMASAELMRFLAESVWFPTALLPSSGVSWKHVSDAIARATLTDCGITVSLDFHFGEHGQIDRVEGLRYRDVHGTPVVTPWAGYFGDYQLAHGMMIPMRGSVAWAFTSGPEPYWRARIVSAELRCAPRADER